MDLEQFLKFEIYFEKSLNNFPGLVHTYDIFAWHFDSQWKSR